MTFRTTEKVDALIIGGGYYGCSIALHLKARDFGRIVLAEQSGRLMTRSSFVNQARVHGGYHYPRALDTAAASRRYFERFLHEHRDALTWNTQSIYAIAAGSKVSPRQFARVCAEIGAPLAAAPRAVERMFDPTLIDAVFLAEEYAFDAIAIARGLERRLDAAGLHPLFNATARIVGREGGRTVVEAGGKRYAARWVFNCTYAELDGLGVKVRSGLRRELAEIALIRPPAELDGYSVTVMDGPYFSSLPFPAMGAYSLTHVRFTPVVSWLSGEPAPAGLPIGFDRPMSAGAMVIDASRYMPAMSRSAILGSLFDVKAVMLARETDDGRPILFEESRDFPGVVSILGSKIDNVYDVLEALDKRVEQRPAYA